MDHREESKHDAVRREFTRGHAYGLVERNKTRDWKLPRSVQTIVQVNALTSFDLSHDTPEIIIHP